MSEEMNIKVDTNEIFEALKGLAPSQIEYLKYTLLSRGTEKTDELELHCPKCSGSHIIKFGKNRLGKQRYRCKQCLRIFVIPTKSILNCSKKSDDKWHLYMECMAQGMSIRKAAAIVGIQSNTSFYWRHKILNALRAELSDKLLEQRD